MLRLLISIVMGTGLISFVGCTGPESLPAEGNDSVSTTQSAEVAPQVAEELSKPDFSTTVEAPGQEGGPVEAAFRTPINPPPTKLEVFRTDRIEVERDPRSEVSSLAFGLRWIDAGGEQEYIIQQRFRFLEQVSEWVEVGRARANSTSAFVVIEALEFQFLEFRLIARNLPGQPNAESNIAGILAGLTFPPGFAFPAPTGMNATGIAVGKVRLQWKDRHHNEPDSIVYQVEQRTGNGQFLVIAELPPNHDNLTLENLPLGETLTYRVRSVPVGFAAERRVFLPSAYSNESTVRVPRVAPGLLPPSGLQATVVSSSRIDLRWTDNSNNEDLFVISMGPSIEQMGDVALVSANVASRQLTGLSASTHYFFRVRARNDAGDSAFVAADATTLDAGTPPAAPSECLATVFDSHTIELRWRDNSDNEAEFVIENSLNGGATFQEYFVGNTEVFINRDPADPNVIVVTDEDLPAATQFCYRIRARNPGGDSAYSNVSCASTLPPNPTAVRVVNLTVYPVQTLTVNGTEMLPGNVTLPPGFQIDVPVTAGSVQVQAQTVVFDSDGVQHDLYPYAAAANVSNGQTVTVTIDDPSINDIMTNFTGQGYIWEARLSVGDFNSIFQCLFNPDGTYVFQGSETETGTYTLLEYPGDGTALIRMDTSETLASLIETRDEFGHRALLVAGLVFED